MKIFLTIILFISCLTAFGQSTSCEKFKTGNFKMEDPITGVNYISRDKTNQIESIPSLKVKVKLNVEWIDSCVLKLTLNEILENEDDLPISDFILISEIIEIKENSYIMKSKAEDSDFTMTREYTLIE
ncbi:hypothetical protein [Echinicola sp. 20G]|uniref:hypothetical protein n=1 Tax=Echinicola sp. 20G TaxID=2781961 RepID=UPI001910046D|nr:hypothetical protein [Echinicola sp. 20G]